MSTSCCRPHGFVIAHDCSASFRILGEATRKNLSISAGAAHWLELFGLLATMAARLITGFILYAGLL